MKKILIFTSFLLLSLVLPAQQYDFTAVSGTNTLYFKILDPGVKTVAIVPQLEEYPFYTNKPTGSLVIPSTIVYSGDSYNVKEIGANAFYYCNKLTGGLIIPEGVTKIGYAAFYFCHFTGSLAIPESVLEIDSLAFTYCSSFKGQLTLSTNLESIKHGAFALSGFTGDLDIPNSVTEIGTHAFYNCDGFDGKLTLPNSIAKIALSSFHDCSSLKGSLEIPTTVTAIEGFAFYNCAGLTGDLEIGSEITDIETHAFKNCTGFSTLTFSVPSTSLTIGDQAFSNCPNFSYIRHLGSTPPTTGPHANVFQDLDINVPVIVPCASRETYKKASTWDSFLNYIENKDSNLLVAVASNSRNGYIKMTAMPCSDDIATFRAVVYDESEYHVASTKWPDGSTGETYTTLAYGKDSIIPVIFIGNYYDTIITYNNGAYKLYFKLHKDANRVILVPEYNDQTNNYPSGKPTGVLTIPSTIIYKGLIHKVIAIDDYAFYNCPGLTGSLNIPDNIDIIGRSAFQGCTGLTGLTFADGGTYGKVIGEYAFMNCIGLSGSLNFPKEIDSIAPFAFYNCTGFTSWSMQVDESIKKGLRAIGESAFMNGTAFTQDLHLLGSVKTIGDGAFQNCIGFGSLIIDSARSIGGAAFLSCEGLKSLTIGGTVEDSISGFAFYNCSGLDYIELLSNTPSPLKADAFKKIFETTPIKVPCTSNTAYESAPGWKNFTNYQKQNTYSFLVKVADKDHGSTKVTTQLCDGAGNGSVTFKAIPALGYKFKKWSNDMTKNNPLTVTISGSTVYTAEFISIYNVVFNSNGGVGEMDTLTFEHSAATQAFSRNSFTKEGYSFVAWDTLSTGLDSVYSDEAQVSNLSTEVNGMVNLYAVWRANTYTISFITGTPHPILQDFTYDADSVALTKNTREITGYTFAGWDTDQTAKQVVYTDQDSIKNLSSINNDTIKLYAVWDTNSYTIAFHDRDEEQTYQNFTYNADSVALTKITERIGYTFAGWDTAVNAATMVYTDQDSIKNLSSIDNDTIKLYAVWDTNSYTIAFHDRDNITYQNFIYNADSVALAGITERTGYTFVGWDTAVSATKMLYTDQDNIKNLSSIDNDTIKLYAVWLANNYSIVFLPNRGEGEIVTQNFIYDIAQPLTANAFEKEGHTFSGWVTEATALINTYEDKQSVKNLVSTNNAKDTLYALWTANKYTVTFNDSLGDTRTQVFTYGVPQKLRANSFIRDGFKFTGWAFTSTASAVVYTDEANYSATQDTTLYAIWAPTIIIYNKLAFDPNDGSTGNIVKQMFVDDETKALRKNTFTREGYGFDGWAFTSTAIVVDYIDEAPFKSTQDTILYAVWTAKTYTLTFNPNNGAGSVTTQEFTYAKAENLTANTFSKVGHIFSGWAFTANASVVEYGDGASFILLGANDTTLYALWTPETYTITFNDSLGDTRTQLFTYGVPQNLRANSFIRDGFKFTGWAFTSTADAVVYQDEAMYSATQDTTLYAIWEPTIIIYNKLAFDPNDRSTGNIEKQMFEDNETKSLRKNTFTREGYTFDGWAFMPTAIVVDYIDEANFTSTQDDTLYAVWIANTYTLTFNDGVGALTTQDFIFDESQLLKANVFSKEGYEFLGWAFTNNADVAKYEDEVNFTLPSGNDTTLYAVWDAIKYDIFYLGVEGATFETNNLRIYTIETAAFTLNNPTKVGYTFTGWTGNNGTTPQTAVTVMEGTTGLLAYTANWETTVYTISYDLADGTAHATPNPTTYTIETDNFTLNNPTKAGYTFTGWTGSNSAIPQTAVTVTKGTTENLSYTANWKIISTTKYTVTFDKNGGEGSMTPQKFEKGVAQNLTMNTFTKANHMFRGWWSENAPNTVDIEFEDGASYTATTNITFYAVWGADNVSISQFKEAKLVLYPNPATDYLYIKGCSPSTEGFVILNSIGKIVHRQAYTGAETTSIAISNLKAGVYIIQVLSKEGLIQTAKFIKK